MSKHISRTTVQIIVTDKLFSNRFLPSLMRIQRCLDLISTHHPSCDDVVLFNDDEDSSDTNEEAHSQDAHIAWGVLCEFLEYDPTTKHIVQDYRGLEYRDYLKLIEVFETQVHEVDLTDKTYDY